MAKTKWNRKKRWTDGALRMILGVFLYVPIIGTLFQYTFCIKFNIFPSIGVNSPIFDDFISITGFKLIDSLLMGQFLQFFDTVWHLLLPLLTLAVYGISITARWVRKSLLDYFKSNLCDKTSGVCIKIENRTPLVKILKGPTILHCVHPILLSLFFTGILVESIFNLRGIGGLLLDAAYRWDGPVVVGIVHFLSILFLSVNLCIELIQKKNGLKKKFPAIYCIPNIVRAW